MKFSSYLDPQFIFTDLKGKNPEEIITEMIERLSLKDKKINELKDVIVKSVIKREKEISTGMGNGIAIEPTDNKVYAPFDGEIEFIAESKHAIGLKSEDGVELLIHVGMDTVQMDGKGFDVKVKANEKVKAGELLLEFDKEAIQKAGYSLITPVVITNSFEFEQKELCLDEDISYGKSIINLSAVNA